MLRTSRFQEATEAARPAWMELDLGALAANIHAVRRRIGPDTKIIASIKANAYGHGAVQIARKLANLDVYAFAIASFHDAVALREAGIETSVLLFGGNLPEGASELLRYHLIPTVYNLRTAEAISAAARAAEGSPAPVYIKVDCGLGRLGVPVAEAAQFVQRVSTLPWIKVEGIYTHLPFTDAEGRAWAEQRIKTFDDLIGTLTARGLDVPVTQAIASAGLLAGLRDSSSAVCPGHILFGISPVVPEVADFSHFRPVLRAVKCRLIHTAGHPVKGAIDSYGKTAPGAGRTTGVVPLGMYDGYRSPAASQTAAMLVRGHLAPVLGVSLEHTTLDLTGIDGAAVGDEVTALGEDGGRTITLGDIAAWRATSSLEVLMSFDGRLPKRYVREGAS